MKKSFGILANGQEASLYTISCGKLTAEISDYGAILVRLYVPDAQGNLADVVQGYDDPNLYSRTFFGATVGRNANRLKNASFSINGPDGDQGFPGNTTIYVTYSLEAEGTLRIVYDAVCDKDTIFNMTNHSFFNLAGHDHPELAMEQILTMPARFFNPDDAESIPTGELRPVEGTPMDFRTPKPIGRDINEAYDPLILQKGYDHNFEVYTNPCAILTDPHSGRTMEVHTDCPGIQFYSGNYTDEPLGKDDVSYGYRSAICLETQYYPDVTKAGEPYHSETRYVFR